MSDAKEITPANTIEMLVNSSAVRSHLVAAARQYVTAQLAPQALLSRPT